MNALPPAGRAPVPLQSLVPSASANPLISGISLDSRSVQPGWIYAALPGSRAHGASYAGQAIAAGAAAVVTDEEGARIVDDVAVPVVVLPDVRAGLGVIAAGVFGRPADDLLTLGVTGTNGKTTTVQLLAAGLEAAGRMPATVGTLGFLLAGESLETERSTVTTPEAPDLQALLAHFLAAGADSVALEVSSHALELHRVGGLRFDIAGFLNLGHDHLDFHGTPEAYFRAKRRLFDPELSRRCVIWLDEHGSLIAEDVRAVRQADLVTVGFEDADYVLGGYRPQGRLGGVASVTRGGERLELRVALPGQFNMIDAAVALAMLESAGISTSVALAGLARAQVPGRMQRVVFDDEAPLIIVDFAHTPQAVAATLETLGQLGPVTTVLGCGGDRDARKRPAMGRVAAELSSSLIVTDDNPRSEPPAEIRAAMLTGARAVAGSRVVEIGDRQEAIEHAIRSTPASGVVAILGKGHERGQILADRVVDFSDALVARSAWERMRGRA
ncbi:UDP-N-acetylmuramoyl-L-alanyl-D-glutamate--2,6-diaminopimelate ligase [Tessaracoccus sp. OH4464_COT-324]|uniref:UDP-N-acetylmuramoyl-L-alanyl-D-glutamate--2, 6-diaminopimelate ligase n=1 Tax=Tessaracoccus sp. OH4464_COT-324 TaxID=2491059 RepID=UPI000F641E41|nr:UDP-N-acetylmuramoyl-L-alanyl-D-glutamate--2,6-diaminopimelate ligase [Tessaracoccus sp. OH4464_COT-324]RRD47547.1 UDP-N-acetylmuramoyl-L-alanyl-D-glutamate--2,6-diaminopimelate ligase [Tessaracoccus sp. OH4464_COT-324]